MKRWDYANAERCSTGIMVCASCHKDICGEYRYRDAGERYINQHRECSADDPNWAKRDKAEAARRSHFAAMRRAAIEFRDKWGVTDLADILDEGIAP